MTLPPVPSWPALHAEMPKLTEGTAEGSDIETARAFAVDLEVDDSPPEAPLDFGDVETLVEELQGGGSSLPVFFRPLADLSDSLTTLWQPLPVRVQGDDKMKLVLRNVFGACQRASIKTVPHSIKLAMLTEDGLLNVPFKGHSKLMAVVDELSRDALLFFVCAGRAC